MNDKGIGYRGVISNPTPVGIGIAVAKQLLKLDIMGEVEEQIANTRQIQLHEEDRHKEIASINKQSREADIKKLQSKHRTVFNNPELKLSSKISVLTSSKTEVPKVSYDNLKKYLDPPKIFKEADKVKAKVVRINPKLKKTEKERKDNAKKIIENYSKSTKIGKWKKISKLEFVTELTKIVDNPTIIDQSTTNLCGIALPVKLLAEEEPEKFVNMALSLFENGSYYGIDANPELMEKNPTKNLKSVEYVVLSSVKNELNYVKYDPESDWGFSGMTTPWEFNKLMEDWFGFTRTTSNYKGTLIRKVEEALNMGDKVTLLINGNGFLEGIQSKLNPMIGGTIINVPTHYIEVRKITRIVDNKLIVDIWHWGKDMTKQKDINSCKIEISISDFEKYTHKFESWK